MEYIQMDEAEELRKRWKEKYGDKPCDHPNLLKEYYLGTSTGDYVCEECGQNGWGSRWNKKK